MNTSPVLKILKIPNTSTLVIKQLVYNKFFVTTKDSIVISTSGLATILQYLLRFGYISPKLLEGVLEEYNTDGKI